MKYIVGVCTVTAMTALGAIIIGSDQAVYAQDKEYVGVNQCKLCHSKPATGDQFNKWNAMKHAQAYEVLSSERALEVAKELKLENPPNQEARCLKCHVTSYDEVAKAPHPKIDIKMGVQCESCHGPASEHLKDGKTAMMKKDAELDFSANIIKPAAEDCTKCHNDENPTWNPEKYELEDGTKTGFDFDQAYAVIAHPNPEKAAEK